jgi:hypothetical protein
MPEPGFSLPYWEGTLCKQSSVTKYRAKAPPPLSLGCFYGSTMLGAKRPNGKQKSVVNLFLRFN